MYTPVNEFYCIQVGFKGVKIIQACFRDVLDLGARCFCDFISDAGYVLSFRYTENINSYILLVD